jgi:hypothetical protein
MSYMGSKPFSGDGFALAIFRNEKVLDRLATSEKTTIVVERAPGGKMRVTSGSWGR